MSDPLFVGQTIRATVSLLEDAGGNALTAPTVTISLTAPDGTVSAGSVVQQGATYYAEFTPDDAGRYKAATSAVAGNGTWKGREFFVLEDL